jgi:hypothetical protein
VLGGTHLACTVEVTSMKGAPQGRSVQSLIALHDHCSARHVLWHATPREGVEAQSLQVGHLLGHVHNRSLHRQHTSGAGHHTSLGSQPAHHGGPVVACRCLHLCTCHVLLTMCCCCTTAVLSGCAACACVCVGCPMSDAHVHAPCRMPMWMPMCVPDVPC